MSSTSSLPAHDTNHPVPVAATATLERSVARHLLILGGILLVGVVLRIVLLFWFQDLPPRIVDEQSYNQVAVNLVNHGEFSSEPGIPTSLRPPLYPAILAGVYSVFGVENYQAVRILQVVVSLLTVVLVWRLGSLVFSPRVGLWAAALFCFYPSFIGLNYLLLTEVFFTFFLCAACTALVLSLKRQSLGWLALAGVCIGLGALTRSILWLFPPVLACFLLVAWRGSFKGRVLAAATVVATAVLTIAPWAVRNTRLQKTFLTVDCMGGRNFMMGNYQHTPLYRSWDAISIQGEKAWYHEIHTTYPASERDTQGKVDKLALRQGLRFVKSHPWLTFKRDVVKFFDFWGLERAQVRGAADGLFGPIPRGGVHLLTLLICGSYVAALFLGIFGVVLTPPEDRRMHWLFLLLFAFICGIHTLVFGHSRYHLPLIPLICLYAASALVHARTLWHRRRWPFWLAAGLCLFFASGWVIGLILGDLDRIRRVLGGA
jgi:4-amino-4-deoxy-L-arabinose transferase-like glycosyltransferase